MSARALLALIALLVLAGCGGSTTDEEEEQRPGIEPVRCDLYPEKCR